MSAKKTTKKTRGTTTPTTTKRTLSIPAPTEKDPKATKQVVRWFYSFTVNGVTISPADEAGFTTRKAATEAAQERFDSFQGTSPEDRAQQAIGADMIAEAIREGTETVTNWQTAEKRLSGQYNTQLAEACAKAARGYALANAGSIKTPEDIDWTDEGSEKLLTAPHVSKALKALKDGIEAAGVLDGWTRKTLDNRISEARGMAELAMSSRGNGGTGTGAGNKGQKPDAVSLRVNSKSTTVAFDRDDDGRPVSMSTTKLLKGIEDADMGTDELIWLCRAIVAVAFRTYPEAAAEAVKEGRTQGKALAKQATA